MATATMGLRRRVPVNGSPVPSNQSPSGSASTVSNKRSRSENNNSPSHGNLNSTHGSRDEPPTKKSRGTSTCGTKGSSGSSSTTTATSSPSGSSTSESSQSCKSRSSTVSRSSAKTSSPTDSLITADSTSGNVIGTSGWQTNASDSSVSYQPVTGLGMPATGGGQPGALCSANLGMTTPIPYMSTSMATFVGNATNLGKNSSVSYLDISNMTSGSLSSTSTSPSAGALGNVYTCSTSAKASSALEPTGNVPLPFSGIATPSANGNPAVRGNQKSRSPSQNVHEPVGTLPRKFQNDGMYDAYQPWVIKTYGDLAKTKTITIKKYARILRTLRGEEVNSAENSKFRFWVKSKGFHIGQPEGYDAKPADRIVGRHAVTGPGLDPPLYVPTQLPHNKALNGAEGTVPPGRVYKKVAIVENFFDIIHAVHVDLEGRPGKHAGQKRTYRTITETYAFLPREAVTRFLLGCTECQRRPRTPSPSSLSNQSQSTSATAPTSLSTSSSSSISTPLSPTPSIASSVQSSPKYREASEGKTLYGYRHQRHHRGGSSAEKVEKEKDKEEKYNPLSITNLLKKEPSVPSAYLSNTEASTESRRTPESDRASSRGSVSSKRKRMLPEGRRSTPSPQPGQPITRPWSPGLDPKSTAIDYSLPITTSYLKHQQRLLLAEKKKKKEEEEEEEEPMEPVHERKFTSEVIDSLERERFSPAAGLIDTNLNLLATIQHLHCQVMLALNERLRPIPATVLPAPLVLPTSASILPNGMSIPSEVLPLPTAENTS